MPVARRVWYTGSARSTCAYSRRTFSFWITVVGAAALGGSVVGAALPPAGSCATAGAAIKASSSSGETRTVAGIRTWASGARPSVWVVPCEGMNRGCRVPAAVARIIDCLPVPNR
jgi:hypothetical protein